MATVAEPLARVQEESSRAGVSPLAEFLLVGGATPVLFALGWVLRRVVGLDAADLAFGFTFFYAAHLLNDPHFAVTYVLFYRKARERAFGRALPPAQRTRYVAAGLIAPAAMLAWAGWALATRSSYALGLFIQLMFFTVGWHYCKQGFGVLTVLSARRGVRFLPRERGALLAHAYAAWAYAWASPHDAGTEVEEKGVVYTTIAHGLRLEQATHVVFLATAAWALVVLALKWKREGRLPIATPLVGFVVSLWVWSVYSSADALLVYAIPALHSLQYLYFVGLMKGAEAREREGPPWFERAAKTRMAWLAASALGLGWLLFHGAPTALDDLLVPRASRFTAMGPTPWFAAIYTFVNVHHFLMDAVLWRRESPEARYLFAR